MTEAQLYSKLSQEFKGAKIIKLESMVKKIVLISKVRVSKDRKCLNYDEISLNNIDERGIVFIPKNTKKQLPANCSILEKQSLKYGDLVLNRRTTQMKVGFIDKSNNYRQVIVGNNSMIRITFDCNTQINRARFIQLYLQLPFVLEHLNNLSDFSIKNREIRKLTKLKYTVRLKRKLTLRDYQFHFNEFFEIHPIRLLSSILLRKLPIPEFLDIAQTTSLSEKLYPKMDAIAEAKSIRNTIEELINKLEEDKLALATKCFTKYDESASIHMDIDRTKKLLEIKNMVKKLDI